MSRVSAVGSDTNRTVSVFGSGLLAGGAVGSIKYYFDNQKVNAMVEASKEDAFVFAKKVGPNIEELVQNSPLIDKLNNGFIKLKELEEPLRAAELKHEQAGKAIGKAIGELRKQKGGITDAAAKVAKQADIDKAKALKAEAIRIQEELLKSPEYQLAQGGIKTAKEHLMILAQKAVNKINLKNAAMLAGFVTLGVAITTFILDAKKKRDLEEDDD